MEIGNLQNLDVNRGHEPVGIPLNRPSAFARPTADEPGTFSPTGGEGRDEGVRFMGSLHDFRITHRDHEPATDRSADSLVRECLGLDSCGHGCPRSDSRFMGRRNLQNLDAHRGHEPDRHPSPGPLPARRGEGGRRPGEGRFMERGHLQNSDLNRGHEPIPIVLFISNDLRVRFMESLLSLLRTHWDHEPPPHPVPLPQWGRGWPEAG